MLVMHEVIVLKASSILISSIITICYELRLILKILEKREEISSFF